MQRLDLCFQGLVLLHLTLKKAAGKRHFLSDALWGEQINILKFVLTILEVLHFDLTLIHQCVEEIVQTTHTHTQFFSQLALG